MEAKGNQFHASFIGEKVKYQMMKEEKIKNQPGCPHNLLTSIVISN